MATHQLHTEIEIDASPDTVWAILTDVAAYQEWNPFITSAEGEVVKGGRLLNRIEPPGGKPMTFKPTITEVDEPRVFEWLGRFLVPGLFDGRHRFELIPTSDGTRLVHTEEFQGVLVGFFKKSLDAQTVAGFEAMNAALKGLAEARCASER